MKNVTRIIVFCTVAFATSVIYGGQEGSGVYGVDVVVKQNPSKHDVTNADGYFVLEALPPGCYTLSIRARSAKNLRGGMTNDKVIVATLYSIKVEGTKGSVSRSGLTSDKLLSGVDIPVEVGASGKIRGRVLPGASKKMVWIMPQPGSHLPGHWAEEGSEEAASAYHTESYSARAWQDATR